MSRHHDQRSCLIELKRHLSGKALPTACSYVLLGLCEPFRPSLVESESQRARNPLVLRFWELGFSWTCLPRSSKDMQMLHDYMTVCRCTPAHRAQLRHRIGEDIAEGMNLSDYASEKSLLGLFFLFMAPFIECACIAYDGQHPVNTNRLRRLRRLKHDHATWPRSLDALIPHGAEATTQGLCAWLQVIRGWVIRKILLDILYALVLHCHPLTLNLIIESEVFLHDGIIDFIRRAHEGLTLEPLAMSTDFCDLYFALYSLGHFIHRFIVDHSTLAQQQAFHSREPKKLLRAYAQALALIDVCAAHKRTYKSSTVSKRIREQVENMTEDTFECIRTQYMFAGAQILITHPGILSVTSDPMLRSIPPKVISGFREMQQILQMGEWLDSQVIMRLDYLDIAQRCMAPGCCLTAETTPLHRCSGCLRVRYCSRECQRRAWMGGVPHKNVCSVINRFCKVNNVPSDDVRQLLPAFLRFSSSTRVDAQQIIGHLDAWSRLDKTLMVYP